MMVEMWNARLLRRVAEPGVRHCDGATWQLPAACTTQWSLLAWRFRDVFVVPASTRTLSCLGHFTYVRRCLIVVRDSWHSYCVVPNCRVHLRAYVCTTVMPVVVVGGFVLCTYRTLQTSEPKCTFSKARPDSTQQTTVSCALGYDTPAHPRRYRGSCRRVALGNRGRAGRFCYIRHFSARNIVHVREGLC